MWQHGVSASTCQVLGSDSQISMYSLARIFGGGTELKSGRLAKSPDGPPPTTSNASVPVEVPEAAAGHTDRDDEPTTPVPLSEAPRNVGSEREREISIGYLGCASLDLSAVAADTVASKKRDLPLSKGGGGNAALAATKLTLEEELICGR